MIKRVLLGLFMLTTISQFSQAQDLDKQRLDIYFQTLERNKKFMGSVAIAKEGKMLYAKAIGFSDVEKSEKADESSKYRIGSISKTFTAALVLKAVEEKKLALNQTIQKYFPTIKNADKITLTDLLYHRSGIHNFTDDESYLKWYTKPKTEAEMVAIIAAGGSDFTPDSKSDYSNSNYVLLSYVLEKAYNQPFHKILSNVIIQPLELNNTSFGGKIDGTKKECYSYKFTGNWEKEAETDPSIPMGAGAIVSTPTDLVKFMEALFNSNKIISPKSLEIMKTIKGEYGMGLFQVPFLDKKGFGHTGGIDGFSSVLCYFPEDKVAVALTCNGSNYSNNDIMIAMLSSVYGKQFSIPEFKTFDISSSDLDKYLGTYASKQLRLKLTVTKNGNTLIAQGTGQPSFPLEAIEKDHFKFTQGGIEILFNIADKTMELKQGGVSYSFNRE
jgi:D-alanyl-D-alanine carboxypeptidase